MTLTRHELPTNTRHKFGRALLVAAVALGPAGRTTIPGAVRLAAATDHAVALPGGPITARTGPGTDMSYAAPVRAASLVTSLAASPTVLGPGGGVVRARAELYDAAHCRLELLSRQDFPVVYASNLRPCVASFTAKIEIGANPTNLDRVVSFELVATHGAYNFLMGAERSVSRFSIVVLDRARTPFVRRMWSGNWSGYAVEGGPFREAAGSFVVPLLRIT